MQTSQEQDILHAIHWFRVVLNEAHTIKSSKIQTSLAAHALIADCQWCLTGIPIQVDILFALLNVRNSEYII